MHYPAMIPNIPCQVHAPIGREVRIITPVVRRPVGQALGSAELADGIGEFETYLRNNCEFIPNFGERRRQGETISTAFVESTINQVVSRRFVKKQQMQWTLKGAHLLLQTRTKVLNNELENTFKHWYPEFRANAAGPPTF